MKRRLYITLAIATASVMPGFFLFFVVAAQGQVPGFPITYSGYVTVADRPAPDGLEVSARIGEREFGPVITSNGRYAGLTIQGNIEDSNEILSFFLMGLVQANVTDVYKHYASPPVPLEDVFRSLDLDFPFMPVPTPTPTLIPTVTPTPTNTPTPSPLGPLPINLQSNNASTLHLGDDIFLELVITPAGHHILLGEVAVIFDRTVMNPIAGYTGPVIPHASHVTEIRSSLMTIGFFQGGEAASTALEEPGAIAIIQFKIRNDATVTNTEIQLLPPRLVDNFNQPIAIAIQNVSVKFSIEGIPGDINRDGTVDILDLAILGASYETGQGSDLYNGRADLNEDGKIGSFDLSILSSRYNEAR